MDKRLFDEVNIIGPMKILKMNQLELTLSVILHQMILEIWKTPHKKYQKKLQIWLVIVMTITIFIWILINSKEQHAINNVNWAQTVEKSFKVGNWYQNI